MKRVLFAALALSTAAAFAQVEEFDGVLTVTHGYTTGPDGARHSLVGERIPFHGELIRANKLYPLGWVENRKSPGPTGGPDTLIYRNDNAADYFYSGFPMPSALDDVTLDPGGIGARWMSMSVGMNFNFDEADTWFFVRWIGYTSFVSGRGAGVSAFDNPTLDFGGALNLFYVNPAILLPGSYKLTFNLSQTSTPVSFPQSQMYFAQQFRMLDGAPDSPFFDQIDTVFSGVGVTVGSSADIFWYDNDPAGPDGIYDETENDQFDPPHLSNFLLVIDAQQTGTTDTRLPSSFSYLRGRATGGSLSDLWDSDDSYVTSVPGLVFSSTEAPLQMVIESTAVTTTATAIKLNLEAKASIGNVQQRVHLWNFTTSQWVEVDSRVATTTDSTITTTSPGTPAQFIEAGTRKIRARLSWKSNQVVFSWPWNTKVDRAVWLVTRP
jgi:hypothetical protein